MSPSDEVIVIGAGVIGSAVAYALAHEGHAVRLLDREEPGCGGASYGNAGHLATELIEPLPSRELLFGFWRERFERGGPLDIPLARLGSFAPWALRFARAAFARTENTRYLEPLVRPAAGEFRRWFARLGRTDLIRAQGHYQVWLSPQADRQAAAEADHMNALGIPTQPMPQEILISVMAAAGGTGGAGLCFPESGHVIDPLEVVRALVKGATDAGARFERRDVRALRPAGAEIEIVTGDGAMRARTVVVCAGAWAAPLLAPFGLRAPLEAAHGYHVEIPGHAAHVDAPLLYMDQKVLVTPMAGRLRASTYMEFSGLESGCDLRKPARLRRQLRDLGYACETEGKFWRGPRPVLPDYLPGIGRATGGHRLFYAIGHQHLGLTLAPVTGDLMTDIVAGRTPRLPIDAFNLGRFG